MAEDLFVAFAQLPQTIRGLGNVVRQHADQHLGVIAVAQNGFQVGPAQDLQTHPGICFLGHRFGGGLLQRSHARLINREQQLFLGGEVVVERAGLHVDLDGDVSHGGCRVSAAREKARRGVQQLRQAVVGSR